MIQCSYIFMVRISPPPSQFVNGDTCMRIVSSESSLACDLISCSDARFIAGTGKSVIGVTWGCGSACKKINTPCTIVRSVCLNLSAPLSLPAAPPPPPPHTHTHTHTTHLGSLILHKRLSLCLTETLVVQSSQFNHTVSTACLPAVYGTRH